MAVSLRSLRLPLIRELREFKLTKTAFFIDFLATYLEVQEFCCLCEYQWNIQICSLNYWLAENNLVISASPYTTLWLQLQLAVFFGIRCPWLCCNPFKTRIGGSIDGKCALEIWCGKSPFFTHLFCRRSGGLTAKRSLRNIGTFSVFHFCNDAL